MSRVVPPIKLSSPPLCAFLITLTALASLLRKPPALGLASSALFETAEGGPCGLTSFNARKAEIHAGVASENRENGGQNRRFGEKALRRSPSFGFKIAVFASFFAVSFQFSVVSD